MARGQRDFASRRRWSEGSISRSDGIHPPLIQNVSQSGISGRYPISANRTTNGTAFIEHHHDLFQISSAPETVRKPSTGDDAEKAARTAKNPEDPGGPLPWLHRPLSDPDGPWLSPESRATDWISLFYDLAVVAVLQDFSSGHSLNLPGDIPTFLSYFVIVYLIWHTQTQYDMRFQSNDVFHLVMKFLQIALLLYQGASSGNWTPQNIQTASSAGLTGQDVTYEEQGERSFITVVIAFAVSRLLLAVQYAVLIWRGRRAQRPVTPFLITLGSLVFATVTAAIAAAIPATSGSAVNAKLAMLYLGVGVETLEICSAFLITIRPKIPLDSLRERYGSFILVILGEGLVTLVRALNAEISGLSGSDPITYVQAFLAIVIVFLFFLFLFSHFPKVDINPRRAYIWLGLQFPLAFGLLIFLAGLVNVITGIAFFEAITLVIEAMGLIGFDFFGRFTPSDISADDSRWVTIKYLNRLQVDPPISAELGYLNSLANSSQPSTNLQVVSSQYYASVLLATLEAYNIEINDDIYTPYTSLYKLDTSFQPNITLRNETGDEAILLVADVFVSAYGTALPGVVWLLPTAGIVLLLATCRTLLWTLCPSERYPYRRLLYHLVIASQALFGVILGLLGLLAIGPTYLQFGVESNPLEHRSPLYRTYLNNTTLVIPAVVLLLAWFGPRVIARIVWWRKRRTLLKER